MNFVNIMPEGAAPKILNVDHISSVEQWIVEDAAGGKQVKGCVIRMATVAAKDDLQAPVKHVTSMMIGTLLGKLTNAGARLIP